MCGERKQISLEPYTELPKQSPSLHIRKVRIEFFWNFLPMKREISKDGHHHQFSHHCPFPFQIHTIKSPKPTSTTVHFFSQFCRFGYKTLLLIDFFFCSVGLDLIRFCYGFLDSLSKCLFSQF